MCDRRVLEALGHDSLVDLAQRSCELIQELDATLTQVRAERDAMLQTIPVRYATGIDPGDINAAATLFADLTEGRMYAVPDGVKVGTMDPEPTGAENGQEDAPRAPQGPVQPEPEGPEAEGNTLSGATTSPNLDHLRDLSQIRDTWGELWIKSAAFSGDRDGSWWFPASQDTRAPHRLEWVADQWGPLEAVSDGNA